MSPVEEAVKRRDAELKRFRIAMEDLLDSVALDRMWLYTVPVSGRQPVIATPASDPSAR